VVCVPAVPAALHQPDVIDDEPECDLAALSTEFIDGIPSKLTAQLLPWHLHFSFNALAYVYGPSWRRKAPISPCLKSANGNINILASLKSYVLSMRYDLNQPGVITMIAVIPWPRGQINVW